MIKRWLYLLCGCLFFVAPGVSQAQGMRPAIKVAIAEITHFTLSENEQKDFALQLGTGSYFLVWDVKRSDGKPGNIIAKVQLLKTNGVMVNEALLRVNEISAASRVGVSFKQAKPLAARLRVVNDHAPLEVWMRVVPAEKMTFMPFLTGNEEIKPVGIGTEAGRGGTLKPGVLAYHSATLPAGTYDVSLYMRRTDGANSNIQGKLEQMDSQGFLVSDGLLSLNEISTEARKEKRLVLKKPTRVLFRVTNGEVSMEYTLGIEKASD